MYYDKDVVEEWEPYVVKQVSRNVSGDNKYYLILWNMNADSRYMGPAEFPRQINPFAGEKEITSLRVYPCQYLKRDKMGRSSEEVKASFIERGKLSFKLQRKSCWRFDGFSTTFPRRPVSVYGRPHTMDPVDNSQFLGYTMVDPIQYQTDMGQEGITLAANFENDPRHGPPRNCCTGCGEIIQHRQKKFRFSGYSQINPLGADGLTDHQYFLCDRATYGFFFPLRQWSRIS